ncbi:MAG: RIO1 family regulatory kinase/ATPase [Vulcanimicrobiota bacterium]
MLLQDLRPARKDSPTVRLMSNAAGPFVRKSYRHCPLYLRETVGRMAVNRECRALECLKSSGHAPEFLARPDRFTVEMEYVEGTPLESLQQHQYDPELLHQQAVSLLRALEQADLAHGDLGHDHWQSMGRESNLIWTPDQRLVAIDFSGSVPLKPKFAPAKKFCLALHHHDRLLLSKVAYHFHQDRLGQPEQVRWPTGLWELLRLMGKI